MMVKVCGITRREDALAAAEAGASAIGFIFYPHSPRYITPRRAAELGEGLGLWKVGIFVDDHGVVPRAFEQAAADATGDRARDFAPDAARAGERNQRYALIFDQPACLVRTVAYGQREHAMITSLQHRRVHDVLNCHGRERGFR